MCIDTIEVFCDKKNFCDLMYMKLKKYCIGISIVFQNTIVVERILVNSSKDFDGRQCKST